MPDKDHFTRKGTLTNTVEFFFDESGNSHGITLKEGGRTNLLDPNVQDAFVGVFLGFPKYTVRRATVDLVELEEDFRDTYHRRKGEEMKSDVFIRKNFVHGVASLTSSDREFLFRMFGMLIRYADMVEITYTSKTHVFVRRLLKDMDIHVGIPKDIFLTNLTRFIKRFCDEEFYRIASQNTDDAAEKLREYLKARILRVCKEAAEEDSEDIDHFVSTNVMMSVLLDECDFDLNHSRNYGFPYEMTFGWFRGYLSNIGVAPSRCHLTIDGEEGLYDRNAIGLPNVDFADSEASPMIRLCDFVAGFVSKMIWAIEESEKRNRRLPDDGSKIFGESGPALSEEWFDLDESGYKLYCLINEVFGTNGLDSATSTEYADGCVALHALAAYISIYPDYETFLSVPREEHVQRYDLACIDFLMQRNARMQIRAFMEFMESDEYDPSKQLYALAYNPGNSSD